MGLGGELEEEEEEWVKAVTRQEDNHQSPGPAYKGRKRKKTQPLLKGCGKDSPGESHASARTGSGNIFSKEPESEH